MSSAQLTVLLGFKGGREHLFGESFGMFLIIVADLPWRDKGD